MFAIVGHPSSLFINWSLFQGFLPAEGRHTSLFNRLGLRSITLFKAFYLFPSLSFPHVQVLYFSLCMPFPETVSSHVFIHIILGHTAIYWVQGGLHGPSEMKYSLSPNPQLVARPAVGTDKLLLCLDSQQLLQCLCSENREGRKSGKSWIQEWDFF